jgi:AcrR family transcriptional regulator
MADQPGHCDEPGEGLRERKKRRTRREISDVATQLFAEHGFDTVTLAQIAEASDVSIKTIFNHFGSKEDLYFDRVEELWSSLARTVSERSSGVSVLQALRALLVDNRVPLAGEGWDSLSHAEHYARHRAFCATQDRSPALRARRLTLGEELGHRLTHLLADELGLEPRDPALLALVAMLVAVLHARDRVLRVSLADGVAAPEVRERVVGFVTTAFDRLERAFGDIDRPA